MLGVKASTSTLAIYGETGRFPLSLRYQYKMVKYYQKLCSHSNKLVKGVLSNLQYLDSIGYTTWVTYVRTILLCNNMLDNNSYNKQCDTIPLNKFKDVLYTTYVTEWFQSINNVSSNPILRTYCKFKKCYCIEPYLLYIRDFKLKQLLCQLRLSSHRLHIETGRHGKPSIPIENRTCLVCKSDAIEDEEHFVQDCSMYTDLRSDLIENIRTKDPNFNFSSLFINVMSHRNEQILFCLAVFLSNVRVTSTFYGATLSYGCEATFGGKDHGVVRVA